MKKLVSESFATAGEANDAVERLIQAGYSRNEISVLMHRSAEEKFRKDANQRSENDARIRSDAASGGLLGGALGAIIAASLAATGAIGAAVVTGGTAIPFIAGPLAAAFAGAGAGAATGGILGWLTGLGLTREQSDRIMKDVDAGHIVVALQVPESDVHAVESLLHSPRLSHT